MRDTQEVIHAGTLSQSSLNGHNSNERTGQRNAGRGGTTDLGHVNIATTMIYAEVSKANVKNDHRCCIV